MKKNKIIDEEACPGAYTLGEIWTSDHLIMIQMRNLKHHGAPNGWIT